MRAIFRIQALLLICLNVSLPAPAVQPATIVNIPAIAGKTPGEVRRILGPPVQVLKIRPPGTDCDPCDKAFYRKGTIDIVYIHGRAAWIAVTHLQAYRHEPATLARFGLPVARPSSNGDGMIEWDKIPGYLWIRLFGWNGQAEYLYLKIRNP
ncbi:MAG: hypothetical protein ACAI44_25855 [Candidatus Sericytochromatia bacterium]